MDPLDVVGFARALIDIDSTTGKEPEAARWLRSRLGEMGFTIVEHPLADGRCNLFAYVDEPMVVLSTHYDCVPPFFPSTIRDGRLYGRGACDAKGTLATQLAAVLRLRIEESAASASCSLRAKNAAAMGPLRPTAMPADRDS